MTLIGLILMGSLSVAQAQQGFDVHGLRIHDLGADSRVPLTVPVAPRAGDGRAWAGALFELAERPWIEDPTGSATVRVDDLMAVDLAAGFSPHERIELVAMAPVFLTSTGPQDGRSEGAALGDVRLSAHTAWIRTDTVSVGASGTFGTFTGDQSRYLGNRWFWGELFATADLRVDRWIATAAVGSAHRPKDGPNPGPFMDRNGDAVLVLGSLGATVGEGTSLHLEGRLEHLLDQERREALGTPTELMLTGRHGFTSGGHVLLAVAGSPTRGAGAPVTRVLLGGGFGAVPAAPPEPPEEVRPEPPPKTAIEVQPADAMVWIEHPICEWVPVADAAALLAELPPGTEVQLSAPGFLPMSASLDDGPVALEPAPDRGGLVVIAGEGDHVVVDGVPLTPAVPGVYVANLPPGVQRVEVAGAGRVFEDEVATATGFAVWLTVPDPEPVRVSFGVGSVQLDTAAKTALDALVAEPGDWTYDVRGSYSEEGVLTANLALARQRAQAAANYLIGAGMPPKKVLVGDPLEPRTEDSPAEQRRVVVQPIGGDR